ncbi:hypothetical protein K5X82_07155 [Halosquirtibacter xylanolyticus]|uniref:hypothetical protein n=1 Tax=Halosquirtibacter xylanolyticus TaxID=3374599 RepID=UPI003747A08A|nr:hypothetical protein K5X82_07155 [Prolixibacteraceae bacterium]
MRRYSNITPNAIITFTKWSRKSYALFAVIGRLVRIGFLNMDLSKVDDVLLNIPSSKSTMTMKEEDEEEECIQELDRLRVSLYEGLIPQSTSIPCDKIDCYTYYKKNTRKARCPYIR